MTAITLDFRAFQQARSEMGRPRDAVRECLGDAFKALWECALHTRKRAEISLALTLLNMTIGTGRIGRVVTLQELERGISDSGEDEIGCGVSASKLKEALAALERDGIVLRYRAGGKTLSSLFAINFSAFAKAIARKLASLLSSAWPLGGLRLHIDTYGISESSIEDASIFSSRSGVARGNLGESMLVSRRQVTVAKARPSPYSSAADVVAAVQSRSRHTHSLRAQVAATASPSSLTKVQVQALMDEVRAQAACSVRLVVTSKELGLLRKRIVQYEITDLRDFARHTLSFWATYATQNTKAAARRGGKPIPLAPSFSEFVYRLPYFLKAYQSYKAGTQAGAAQQQQSDERQRIAALTAQLERAREDAASLRRLIRRPAPTTARAESPKTESGLPTWEELRK